MLSLQLSTNQNCQQSLAIGMTQGDIIASAFTIAIDGVPFNLTGASIWINIAFNTLVKYSCQVVDAANGTFFLNIGSTATALFEPGVYDFDLWVQQPGSPPLATQYLVGVLTVNPSTLLGVSPCQLP
jgi:hypothetical protein